jgi:peroxiredoxin
MCHRIPLGQFAIRAVSILLLTVGFPVLGLADDAPVEFIPRGTVIDAKAAPLADVRVTLHRWDGKFSPALHTATTGADGQFEFPSRKTDAYYYAVIRKEHDAPLSQIVGDEGPIKVTLRPAVAGWLEVRDADGKPLEGARVANISVRSEGNTESYIWRGVEQYFGFEFLPSDSAGRLNLPPMPTGALVDVRIDHPRWAQARLANVAAVAGRAGTVTLPPGVMTTFEFVADSRTPLKLDGLACEVLLLAKSSHAGESLVREPFTISDNRITFCAHPTTYRPVMLTVPGAAITPFYESLTIAAGDAQPRRFLVRKTVNVAGRVLHRDGTPHRGVDINAQMENLSPDGSAPGAPEWTHAASAETDAEGKFTIALPPGHCRLYVSAQGFATDRNDWGLDVRVDGPNEVPDFITEPIPPIRGRILDAEGQPVAGAVVRLRHPSVSWKPPVITATDGRFEFTLPRIPIDFDTRQQQYELDLAAFVPDRPLAAVKRIDLRDRESLKELDLRLVRETAADTLLSLEDNQWLRSKGQKARAERPDERYPAGERGQVAPDLDGAAWFNTDGRSLRDFRGRYVLLDFWFTGCGPCHADFPSVKLVHERLEKLGVTVIGVHDNSSSPEAVREHCQKEGLTFPIVVDHPDGRILNAYRPLGVNSFPTYILVGPAGKILENDRATDGPSLRTFKLEVIRKHVLRELEQQ